jgi:hypothetical protein
MLYSCLRDRQTAELNVEWTVRQIRPGFNCAVLWELPVNQIIYWCINSWTDRLMNRQMYKWSVIKQEISYVVICELINKNRWMIIQTNEMTDRCIGRQINWTLNGLTIRWIRSGIYWLCGYLLVLHTFDAYNSFCKCKDSQTDEQTYRCIGRPMNGLSNVWSGWWMKAGINYAIICEFYKLFDI